MSGSWKIWRLALALSLACLSLPDPSTSVSAQSTSTAQYEVQPGDTLAGIALQFGVSVEALSAANPAVDPATLQVGQLVTIPGLDGVSGRLSTHALEAGETLSSLARRYGFKQESVVRLNHIVNPERLYIGQSIVLTDEPDAGPGIEVAQTVSVGSGEGWLSSAAETGHSPWAVAAENALAHPWVPIPGARLAMSGGSAPIRGWPAGIRELQILPTPVTQGQTLELRIVTEAPVTLTATLNESPFVISADPTDPLTLYGLLGVYRLTEPNLYPFTLAITDTQGNATTFTQALPVRAGRYVVDPPLTVDPTTVDPEYVRPEYERVRSVVTASPTTERMWSGLFALPSVGVIRSVFGALRSYNGGPYDSFHGGVDFSGAEDRPITAPAPGIVVMAEPMTVRGNATIIDHGWGVYSGYWHQSSFQVAVGQRVETGQIIGFQGATGRVTGPHLHWEIFVAGVQVDPLEWTERVFP
ncbi:MAG TPA: peptidoglycan DD-metalloendopeptidase family protein [Anaerolineales bacterium]|nr:peptidoglycan DD-metalloendopeptidase family protein [Anaerolineales bacterium]